MQNIDAIFFDLDGTLLDTAPDLIAATHHVLAYHGHATPEEKTIRAQISKGTGAIIDAVFGPLASVALRQRYKQELIQAYHAILQQKMQEKTQKKTQLFLGLDSTFTLLAKHRIPWGIITNKPFWLAHCVVQNMFFSYPPQCLVGGDSTGYSKPHPWPLLYACRQISVSAEKSVYVGDAVTDVVAANAAKMYSIAAAYGYLTAEDQPQYWQADYILDCPSQLVQWLAPRIQNKYTKKTS